MSTPSRYQRWSQPILNERLGYSEPPEPDPDPEDPIDYASAEEGGAVQVAIEVTEFGEILTGETVIGAGTTAPPNNLPNANDRDYETKSEHVSGVFGGSYYWGCDFGSGVEVTSLAVDEHIGGGSDSWQDATTKEVMFSDDGMSYTASTYTYSTFTVPTGLSFPSPTTTTRHLYTLDTPSTHRYWIINNTVSSGFHLGDSMSEMWIYGSATTAETWTPAPAANDGDDATYATWSALIDDAFAQVALEVARLIYRAEVRVAYSAAGSKTIDLYGSTDAVFTSPVLLDSQTFTATGSNTPDDVTFAWVPVASYQYYRLQGVNNAGRLHDLNLFSAVNAGFGVTDHPALTGRDDADQHPATAVTVADSAGWFVGTTVEADFAELAAKAIGYQAHGNTGTTETFDAATGWHSATLNANCTFTLTASPTGTVSSLFLELTQDGTGGRTITLPASVANKTDLEADQDTTLSTTSFLVLLSRDGGTTWYGGWWGQSGGSDLTIEDEGTPLATAATTLDFVGAGVTASGTGAEKTITIPGSSLTIEDEGSPLTTAATTLDFVGEGVTASGSTGDKTITILRWAPVMTTDGTNWYVVVDGDGNAVMSEVA